MTIFPFAINHVLQAALQFEQAEQPGKALEQYQAILSAGVRMTGLYTRIFSLRGFHKNNTLEHNRAMFEREVLPLMKHALATGNYDLALELEALSYTAYVKQDETEEHYEECFRQWCPMMEEAGAAFGRDLPPLRLPEEGGPLRIGFFFLNASLLAHTEVMLNYLKGLHKLEERPVVPSIYVLESPNNRPWPEFNARFEAVGAQVHYLFEHAAGEKTTTQRLLAMRRLSQEHRLSVLTWVSVPLYLAFASAMGVAPVHVWYALRFHPNTFTQVDARIGGGSFFNETGEIRGQTWRTAFVAYQHVYDASLAPKAQAIRERYAGKTILGVIGRPEKLMGAEYLDVLQRIMHANPNSVFLWTANRGAADYPPLEAELARLGIAERCHCIGWVDPLLYAQVFDICLDTFPSPCGLTGVYTMAGGTPIVSVPYVSMLGAYAYPFIIGEQGTPAQQEEITALFRAPDGASYLTVPTSNDEYVAMVQKLIDQPQFRKVAGAAQQRFAHQYMCNQEGLAHRLNRHYLEIVAQARASARKPAQKKEE